MLEKHYKERCEAYEVGFVFRPPLPYSHRCTVQDIQRAAEAALKDLTAHEKKQVSMEERKKHAKTKAKKLEKSLKDVSLFFCHAQSLLM